MKEKIKFAMALLIIILFLPYVCVMLLHSDVQAEDTFLATEMKKEDAEVELFLPGVLAAQIAPFNETEMLKAQAVIARTQVYKMMKEEQISNLDRKSVV